MQTIEERMKKIILCVSFSLGLFSSSTCMADESKPILIILKDGRSITVSSIESEDESGYVVYPNKNKTSLYEDQIILKRQDIMYSIYEDGRMLSYDRQGLIVKNERVLVSKSREKNAIGFLAFPSFVIGIRRLLERAKSIDARDKFREGSAFYNVFDDEAKKQGRFAAGAFVSVLVFGRAGQGTEKYSIRRADGTLLGLEFHSSGLVATLNW